MAENLKKLSSAGLEARLDAAWAAGDDELAAAVSAELARRSEYASPDAGAALAEFYGVYAGAEPLTSSKRVRRMKKRRWLAAAAALFLVIICGALLSPQRVLAADVREESGEIKIFVTARSGSIGWLYDFYQARQLARFCSESPDVPRHAIVTFDGFYGAEYVEELFEGMDSIDTLYAWTPGETGRAIVYASAPSFEGMSVAEVMGESYPLTGERGIFAAEVTGSPAELKALSDAGYDVAVIYSEKAERLSAETGKPISYICVPDKPDGTS